MSQEFEGFIDGSGDLQELIGGRSMYSAPYLLSDLFANSVISKLSGKVFTIIDATADIDKRKAVKDLVRNAFGEAYSEITNVVTTDEYINEVTGGKLFASQEEAEDSIK